MNEVKTNLPFRCNDDKVHVAVETMGVYYTVSSMPEKDGRDFSNFGNSLGVAEIGASIVTAYKNSK